MSTSYDYCSRTNMKAAGSHTPHFRVDLLIDEFNLWLHSYFIAGLVQLAEVQSITLRAMSGQDRRKCLTVHDSSYPLLTLKCTDTSRDHSRLICFDPRDQSNVWHTAALEKYDIYYKRSIYQPDTERLIRSQQVKVRPINPMFATWCSGTMAWNAKLIVASFVKAGHHIFTGNSSRKTISSILDDLRTFAFLSTLNNYEDNPVGCKQKQVLFQTRLWDPSEEKGDWVEDCNRHRVEMIQVLRRRLGAYCVGGLIRTPYAEQNYPELLSNLTLTAKAKRPEFISLCRKFLIRVNVKALFDAVPYSLGETLAANNCLVSESIRNSFATPLVEDEHYLGFTTPDECADRCLELLDTADSADRLREAEYAYYCNAVRPQNAMWMFLEQAMS